MSLFLGYSKSEKQSENETGTKYMQRQAAKGIQGTSKHTNTIHFLSGFLSSLLYF